MQPQSVMELLEMERIARQLRLLNDIQSENLVGSWERMGDDDHFFWSDSMFALHDIPVAPGNLISMEEADGFIFPEDTEMVGQKREELKESGYVEFYFRILCPENKIKRIHAREKKIIENDSVLYRGNWQDELRHKEIQQPLKEANDKLSIQLKVFERAEEVANAGSWQINLETFETIYSDNVYRIYGLAPQGIKPHADSFRKYIHHEDRSIVLKAWEKSYVEMIPLHLEYRIIREDGEVRYISQVSHLLKNGKGEHILSGNTRDVTEQKLLEIQLGDANEVLTLHNELFVQSEQISQLGTWQVNVNTRKTVYSSNLYRLYGLKPYSISPGLPNFMQFIYPDDRDTVRNAYNKAFEENIAPELEFRIIRADGKTRVLRQKSRYIKTDCDELLIGIVQDVTDQQQKDRLLKEANEKLVVQNESFRQAEKVAGIGNWTWNLDTNEMFLSDNVYNIYGLKPQSVPGGYDSFAKYMHPEDRKWLKDIPEKIRTSREPMLIDYRITRADGELRYLRGKSQLITTPEGHSVVIGVTQDITSEVLLNQQLLERIQFAELLSDTIIDRIIVTDTTNNIISWNKNCEIFYKIRKEDVLGKNFFDVLPQLRMPQLMERFKKALAGEAIHVPIMPSMGVMGQFQEVFISPLKNDNDQVIGVLHVMHDITMQQYLQHELSSRLHFIEKLQEASIDRIIALDKDLHFRLWNRQCEKYYGLTKEQVIGKNILEVFPKFKAGPLYRHCLLALEGETVHVPAEDKQGQEGYQESYFVPLKNENGEVTGLLWIMHDLTERFIAEQRLRTSETHLRSAQEIAMMGSFEMSLPDEKIIWSAQTYRIFGYPPEEEITTQKVYDRVCAEDAGSINNAVESLKNGDSESQEVYFRICIQDEVKHLHCRMQAVKDGEGNFIKVLGVIHDITDRKQNEAQLLKQQELLRQAEEIAHVGSWEMDLQSGRLLWSDQVFTMYGYPVQAFEPKLDFYMETIHTDDRALLRDAMDKAIGTGEPYVITCRIFTLDGELKHIHICGRAMQDQSGKVGRIVGTMQDITAQKLIEAELRTRNHLMRTQFEIDRLSEKIANIGSWQWDVKAGKLVWTAKMFRLFGLKPYSFDPTIESFIDLLHPADKERVKQDLADMEQLNEGMLPDYEFRLMVDGRWHYFRVSCRMMKDRYIIGTTMDITQDALLRQQLSEKIRQLEEMNDELRSFAFVASHDLREPLRKIHIFSDWLSQKEATNLSAGGLDRFTRIQKAVVRMDALIDAILDFSRIDTEGNNFSKFDLNHVFDIVKGDLRETINETQAVIEVDRLPTIHGNQSQFAQLFRNLLSNALKYHKPDVIPHIRIGCKKFESGVLLHESVRPDLQYFRISFADNGIGFEEEYARKIFQMFQRLHGNHEYYGTGMGLAICKKIIEHHDGFITASGKPGEGAVFDCYIPVHAGNEVPEQ
jgi:PAS domain S-box-containing protein